MLHIVYIIIKKLTPAGFAYYIKIIADEYADVEPSLRFENEKLRLNDRIESQSSHPLVLRNSKNEIEPFRAEELVVRYQSEAMGFYYDMQFCGVADALRGKLKFLYTSGAFRAVRKC